MESPHLWHWPIDIDDMKTRAVLCTAFGRRTTMMFDGRGRIDCAVDPLSRRATCTYDSVLPVDVRVAEQPAIGANVPTNGEACNSLASTSAAGTASRAAALPKGPTLSDLLLGDPSVYKALIAIARGHLKRLNTPRAWRGEIAANAVGALAIAFRKNPALDQRLGAAGANFAGWLIKALCNFCRKELLKYGRSCQNVITWLPELLVAPAVDEMSIAEFRDRVDAVLEMLSDKDRNIIQLGEQFLGRDHPNWTKLGKALGVCSKTAMRQWQIAKDHFRETWNALDA